MLAITDGNQLRNDRTSHLSTALSYWKASKELFNLKTEKQLRLSMVPKQEREEAPNSVLK